jgi:hypothetical protein
MTASEHRTPRTMLIVAWLIVGLPAMWGVSQTFLKSLDLFRAPAAASKATTAPMR